MGHTDSIQEECEDYDPSYRGQWYILIGSVFLWWSFQLYLEKYCNMAPVIRRTASLAEIEAHVESCENREEAEAEKTKHLEDIIDVLSPAKSISKSISMEQSLTSAKPLTKDDNEGRKVKTTKATNKLKPTKSKNMLMKLTKSIDNENKYRIKTRASILFTKCLFRVLLLFGCILSASIMKPGWIQKHFWDLDHCTTYFYPLQYASALIISYYCWECAMLASYASVQAAVYIHHWFSIIAAAHILFGLYSPLATNYGMFMIAFNPVTDFGTAIRFEYASRFPLATCKILRFGAFYFGTMLVCGWITSVIIITRCFMIGFDNHEVGLWNIIMYIGAMIGWGYDDVHLIQTFYDWSKEDYSHAVFDMDYLRKLASGRVSNVKHLRKFL